MQEEITNITLTNEVAAALIADGCRGDKHVAKQVRANCGEAFNDLLGTRGPDGVDIRVTENTKDTVHVPLPHYSGESRGGGDDAAALSEAEQEQISGSVEIVICALIVGGVSAGVVVGTLLVTGAIVGGVLGSEAKANERAARERSAQRAASSVKTVGGDVGLT